MPPHLRQADGVTCGPSVALMAGTLLDPRRRAAFADPTAGPARFAAEQLRLHAAMNRFWPRALGTTPWAVARAITAQGSTAGMPYRWRLFRGRRDDLADVLAAVAGGKPVAMLIGGVVPRHWALIVAVTATPAGPRLGCYEPSTGDVRGVEATAVRVGRLVGLGYPRPFRFVLPYSNV
jgi:hypothetical protein